MDRETFSQMFSSDGPGALLKTLLVGLLALIGGAARLQHLS